MLQKAQYAADLIDVSFETFTGSISKMETKLRTNSRGFNDLGIATRNANGEMLSTEEIFFNAAEALSQIDNETERDIKRRSSSEGHLRSLQASSMTGAPRLKNTESKPRIWG